MAKYTTYTCCLVVKVGYKCCINFVCLCDLSPNAAIKCCFENIKNVSFTKCVLRRLEM